MGDEYAAFLLGIPTQGTFERLAPTSNFNWYQGYYLADTWEVSKKLTINLGLRWDLPGTIAEKWDRKTILLPDANEPVTNVRGTLALVNSDLWPDRGVIEKTYKQLAPRFGFCLSAGRPDRVAGRLWDLLSRRSTCPSNGAQVSYGSVINSHRVRLEKQQEPGDRALEHAHSLHERSLPGGTAHYAWAQRPQFHVAVHTSCFRRHGWPCNGNDQGIVPDQDLPWVQQWNVSLGRQFPGDFMMEVAYAGSKGSNLPMNGNINLNQLDSQYWSMGDALRASSATSGLTVGQSLRPYPAYNNVRNSAAWLGRTNYHSVQVRMEKRFRSGGVVMGSYTWSRSKGNTDTAMNYLEGGGAAVGSVQNFDDLDAEYGLSSFDTPHRVVVSFVLELPFGKGKRFANWGGVAGALVSGWTINGIYQYRTGFPLKFGSSAVNQLELELRCRHDPTEHRGRL